MKLKIKTIPGIDPVKTTMYFPERSQNVGFGRRAPAIWVIQDAGASSASRFLRFVEAGKCGRITTVLHYCTVLCRTTVLYFTVLYFPVLSCPVLCSTVLYCTVEAKTNEHFEFPGTAVWSRRQKQTL